MPSGPGPVPRLTTRSATFARARRPCTRSHVKACGIAARPIARPAPSAPGIGELTLDWRWTTATATAAVSATPIASGGARTRRRGPVASAQPAGDNRHGEGGPRPGAPAGTRGRGCRRDPARPSSPRRARRRRTPPGPARTGVPADSSWRRSRRTGLEQHPSQGRREDDREHRHEDQARDGAEPPGRIGEDEPGDRAARSSPGAPHRRSPTTSRR